MTDYFIFSGFYAVVYDSYQGGTIIASISGSKADADRECELNNVVGPLSWRVVPLRKTDRITVY